MLITPQKILIYPLLLANNNFKEWYNKNNRLEKSFAYENNNNFCNYFFTCNIKSRYVNSDINMLLYDKKTEPLDYINTELFIDYKGNIFHENFINYRFVNDHKFNYFSLINPLFTYDEKIEYNLSKDDVKYNSYKSIENDLIHNDLLNSLYNNF